MGKVVWFVLWVCILKSSTGIDLPVADVLSDTPVESESLPVDDIEAVAGDPPIDAGEAVGGDLPVDGADTGDVGGENAGNSGGGLLAGVVGEGIELGPRDETVLLPGLADVDLPLDGRVVDDQEEIAPLGIKVIGDDTEYSLDKMNPECQDGKCTVTENRDLIDLNLGIDSKNKFTFKQPCTEYEIIRPFPMKKYKAKNIFGKGVPRPVDETGTCKDYASCKKLRTFPSYSKLESPYLYGTPYFPTKVESGEGVTKKVITRNFFAPGQPSKTYAIANDNTYLRKFKENLMQFCPMVDSCGSCDTKYLLDQTTVYTLEELPCDTFYAALRLYDLERDTHATLQYSDLQISLDEPAGVHWFKMASDPDVAKQLMDTEKLLKLLYLLKYKFSNGDENPFFILKQNYTSVCMPEKERCKPLTCKNDTFYTYDGTCNNPDNALLGRNPTSLLRIGQPHCTLDSVHHCKLPGARTVSLTLGYNSNFISYPKKPYYNIDFENGDYPSFLSLFGLFFMQFAIHDVVKFETRGVHATNQGGKRGCTLDKRHLPKELVHPYAAPIDISEKDPFYAHYNSTCMEFVKAQRYSGDCAVTNPNIGNFMSSYLDLSQLYPKNECSMKDYIAPGGKIKSAFGKFVHLHDGRAPQTPLLIVITQLFGLLHNKISENVKNFRNTLTDYEIFEISRLVNIYVYQHFYDTVISAVLGKEYSNFQGITSSASCYDVSLDPTPLTEFSCAATRYLHAYIPNKFHLLHSDYTIKSIEDLSNLYGGPSLAFTEFKGVFLGSIHQPINVRGHAHQAQNELFKFGNAFGADLFSFDVQRGRDCCLQPYIFYIKKFFGVEIKYWEDLTHYIPVETILQLKQIYSDVCQLELYTGISVEKKYEDGLFGAVGRKIVTEQHLHSRCGDLKHYSNALDPVTKSCLKSIKYNELFASLAGVKTTTKNILLSVSKQNQHYTIADDANPMEEVNCVINAVVNKIQT